MKTVFHTLIRIPAKWEREQQYQAHKARLMQELGLTPIDNRK